MASLVAVFRCRRERTARYWRRLVPIGLLLGGCSESTLEPLEWKIDFACSEDAKATDELSLRVLAGGCSGSKVVYEATFGRGGSAPAKSLDEGTFGLSATAHGPAGVVAESCEEHRLPSKDSITLLLRSASCTAGSTTDASLPDAAGPDASPPDAEVPCMPPKDCRPCAADGDPSDCPPPSCSQFSNGSHTYLFCTDRQQWAGARTECRKNGRDLVIIDSAQENSFVQSHLGGSTHWIGANDRGNNGINSCSRPLGADEGAWYWVNSVSGDDHGTNFCNAGNSSECSAVAGHYMSWGDKEPSNSGCNCIPFYKCDEGEDCAAIVGTGSWQDAECSASLPYVCESY